MGYILSYRALPLLDYCLRCGKRTEQCSCNRIIMSDIRRNGSIMGESIGHRQGRYSARIYYWEDYIAGRLDCWDLDA